jgi:hypothetical protein
MSNRFIFIEKGDNLSKTVSARIKGDDYQACFFWLNACRLFQEYSKVEKIAYEYDPVKSIDDVAVFYKQPYIDEHGDYVNSDFYQVKYHVTQNGSINWKDLLNPKAINATSVSFLQRLHKAQKDLAPDGRGSRFYLVSPWRIHPDDELSELVSNSGGEIRWDKLSKGGDRSKMGIIRKAMKDHLSLTSDDELKVVLRPLRIIHSTDNMEEFIKILNINLMLAGLKPIQEGSVINPYVDLIKGLQTRGKNEFTKDELLKICKDEQLWIGRSGTSAAHSIGIRSFHRWAENIEDETNAMLCLLEYFNGRYIKTQSHWNDIILQKLEDFLLHSTHKGTEHHLHLDTHSSVAFATGYYLDSKSGVNAVPVQRFNGRQVWKPDKKMKYQDYPGWIYEEDIRDEDGKDIVITLGVRHKIIEEVDYYLEQLNLPIRRVINCTIDGGHGSSVIKDGSHAWLLADKIATFINDRPIKERYGHIHIFSAVPNALLFFVGQFARAFGPCTLYEYDFEKRIPGKYEPSITLNT